MQSNFLTLFFSLILIFSSNDIFSQIQIAYDIDGEAQNDNSGTSISLSDDGSILAIGAPGNNENGNNAGHVRVFELIGDTWMQLGDDIDGEAANSQSGGSVSLSSNGNRVAIGSPGSTGNGNDAGQVRIFEKKEGNWTQIANTIIGEEEYDEFGTSVALSSDGYQIDNQY